jgi:hypothetical protein
MFRENLRSSQKEVWSIGPFFRECQSNAANAALPTAAGIDTDRRLETPTTCRHNPVVAFRASARIQRDVSEPRCP